MSDIFRAHRFHTHLLIPWEVVTENTDKEAQLDNIKDWIDHKRSSHYYAQKHIVAHVLNLEQPMFVDRIVKQDIKSGSQDKKQRIVAIDVHWFEGIPFNDELLEAI